MATNENLSEKTTAVAPALLGEKDKSAVGNVIVVSPIDSTY